MKTLILLISPIWGESRPKAGRGACLRVTPIQSETKLL
jgi:hypothetical protein